MANPEVWMMAFPFSEHFRVRCLHAELANDPQVASVSYELQADAGYHQLVVTMVAGHSSPLNPTLRHLHHVIPPQRQPTWVRNLLVDDDFTS